MPKILRVQDPQKVWQAVILSDYVILWILSIELHTKNIFINQYVTKQNTLKIQKDLRLGDYSVEERRCDLYNFLNNLGDWAVFISSGTSVHSSLPLK